MRRIGAPESRVFSLIISLEEEEKSYVSGLAQSNI